MAEKPLTGESLVLRLACIERKTSIGNLDHAPLCHDVVLQSLGGRPMTPGHYSFPFELQLPRLPGTFGLQHYDAGLYIMTLLQVLLVVKAGKESLLETSELAIQPWSFSRPVEALPFAATGAAKSGCCFGRTLQGSVDIKGS